MLLASPLEKAICGDLTHETSKATRAVSYTGITTDRGLPPVSMQLDETSASETLRVPEVTGDTVTAPFDATAPTGSPSDRKSTRLNSSHLVISYAVFCLKKKKQNMHPSPPRNGGRRRQASIAYVSACSGAEVWTCDAEV